MIKREYQIPEVSCIGKQSHTLEMANKLAKKAKKGKITTYKCEHCGGWHVGNTTRPRSQR